MSEEGFLSRWSRRKRQARRQLPAADRTAGVPAAEDSDAGLPGTAGVSPADRPQAGDPPDADPSPSLPQVEELTGDSDLAQFLREGVPAALRNAALRRIWALDPKIRDFVGEARDYGYDWNTAGGVPGSGTVAESEIDGLLRRVLRDREIPAPSAQSRPAAQPQETADPPADPGLRSAPAEQNVSGPEASSEPDPGPPTASRRHGGALPV